MKRKLTIIAFVTVLALVMSAALSFAGMTELISVDNSGNPGELFSQYPSLSFDGRFVTFTSNSQLAPEDTNSGRDIYVRDRMNGTTEIVSIDNNGAPKVGFNITGSQISCDGQYVAFASWDSLVPEDRRSWSDIYVRDRLNGITELISVDNNGNQANASAWYSSISCDGRYVAFNSYASNLVPGDTNGTWDVFLRDRQNGTTRRVSLNSTGEQSNGWSGYTSMSYENDFVIFSSDASNLVPGDTNGKSDVFIHDILNGTTERISVGNNGIEGNNDSHVASFNTFGISGNGRYVVFTSSANNLVDGDTNGNNDVFIRDRWDGTTEMVSLDSNGNQFGSGSATASISYDGRYVAFNVRWSHTYVRDRKTGTTHLISVNSQGNPATIYSRDASISGDGRIVGFYTEAQLVPEDTLYDTNDVYVHVLEEQNASPTANAGADQTIECGEVVSLDGSGSTDPDGDALTYTWTGTFGTATGVNATVTLPLGTHTVTLTVDDGNGGTDTDEVVITVADTTPPSTSATISGTEGNNGWYRSIVTVDLSSTDNCSEVAELSYSVNGATTTVSGGSATVTLGEGTNTLNFFATDGLGNVESIRTLSADVDVTSPEITITGVEDGALYPSCMVPEADFDATDAVSGVAASSESLTSSGAGIVRYTYSVSAEDNAGNTADASVAYEVIDSSAGLIDLIGQYVEAGLISPQMENSLVSQVQNGAIKAFINHVEAQSGKKIDPAAAVMLINAGICL